VVAASANTGAAGWVRGVYFVFFFLAKILFIIMFGQHGRITVQSTAMTSHGMKVGPKQTFRLAQSIDSLVVNKIN
jgi:hypothetical protein